MATFSPDIIVSWRKGCNATFYWQTEKGRAIAKEAKSVFSWVLLSPRARAYDIAAPDAWAADVWNWLEENGARVESDQKWEYVYDEDGKLLAGFAVPVPICLDETANSL